MKTSKTIVNDSDSKPTTVINDLKPGDFFFWCDKLCVKLEHIYRNGSDTTIYANAFDLTNNCLRIFTNQAIILCKDIKIEYKI